MSEHRDSIQHIQITLETKFQLKLTILNVQNKFTQQSYFSSKTEKGNTTIESSILELVQSVTILIFWTKLIQKVRPVLNTKIEHHHRCVHIRSTPGIKFQIKLWILFFYEPYLPKTWYFRLNTGQTNMTIKLSILKQVQVLTFSLNRQL